MRATVIVLYNYYISHINASKGAIGIDFLLSCAVQPSTDDKDAKFN